MPIPRDDPLREPEKKHETFPSRGVRGVKVTEDLVVPTHTLASHSGNVASIGGAASDHAHQPLHKFDATASPGVTADTTNGYSPGSIWVDVSADTAYICVDATEGAAVWDDITAGAGSHGAGDWDQHGDVTLTGEAQGDVLYHNGTAWVNLAAGTSGKFLKTQGAGANPTWDTAGGSPGGSNTQVQFNDGGSFGGDAGLVYDKTNDILTVGGSATGGAMIAGGTTPPSPDSTLHVWDATAGAIAAATDTLITVENSGNAYIDVLSGTGSEGGVYFGDSGSATIGGVIYDHATNTLGMRAGSVTGAYFHNNHVDFTSTLYLDNTKAIVFQEIADHPEATPNAGKGQLWVKSATPNELWFTDDAGTDFQLGTGGAGTPGGSNTQVQFNDGGSFGGDAGLVWDKTNDILTVGSSATGGAMIAGGTTPPSPDSTLHVWDATAGVVAAAANTLVTVENSTSAYISLLTPNTASSGILMGDPEDNDAGRLIYTHSGTPQMAFITEGSTRAFVDSNEFSLNSSVFIGDVKTGIEIIEAADHPATVKPTAGQVWVKSDAPNTLHFTDDAGTDWPLQAGNRKQYVWHIPGVLSAGTSVGPLHATGVNSETVVRIVSSVKTAGTAITFSVNEGSTEDLDTATFTEIDQVAHGTAKGIVTTAGFTDSALAARRLLSLDIDSVTGSPADLTVIMETTVP